MKDYNYKTWFLSYKVKRALKSVGIVLFLIMAVFLSILLVYGLTLLMASFPTIAMITILLGTIVLASWIVYNSNIKL